MSRFRSDLQWKDSDPGLPGRTSSIGEEEDDGIGLEDRLPDD